MAKFHLFRVFSGFHFLFFHSEKLVNEYAPWWSGENVFLGKRIVEEDRQQLKCNIANRNANIVFIYVETDVSNLNLLICLAIVVPPRAVRSQVLSDKDALLNYSLTARQGNTTEFPLKITIFLLSLSTGFRLDGSMDGGTGRTTHFCVASRGSEETFWPNMYKICLWWSILFSFSFLVFPLLPFLFLCFFI